MERIVYVYIMASKSRVIYVGMTNDLADRTRQHKLKKFPGFTQQYNVTRLVWFEEHGTAFSAILREKEIKGWRRSKKVALIEEKNARWDDLSEGVW
jgi:putative endonuclease